MNMPCEGVLFLQNKFTAMDYQQIPENIYQTIR